MSKQASEFQEKSMFLVYRGKEIFKPLNTGRIDERVSCIRHKTISSGDDCCECCMWATPPQRRWRTADQSERIREMHMPVVRRPGQ